jgi:hypothetical protein
MIVGNMNQCFMTLGVSNCIGRTSRDVKGSLRLEGGCRVGRSRLSSQATRATERKLIVVSAK